MKRRIDVTLPFIAIREDVAGSYFARTMGEYFCNPLAEPLLDVEISTGGFYSEEFGVVESNESEAATFGVAAFTAVRFGLSTRDEYDEMVLHWTVRYRTSTGGTQTASFSTFKRLTDTQSFADVPILGGPGQVVPRS